MGLNGVFTAVEKSRTAQAEYDLDAAMVFKDGALVGESRIMFMDIPFDAARLAEAARAAEQKFACEQNKEDRDDRNQRPARYAAGQDRPRDQKTAVRK